MRRLREVAEKVKEELWEIDDIGTTEGRDLTPTRMEFIDYRKEHLKKDRTRKIHEEAKTFKFKEALVKGLTEKVT